MPTRNQILGQIASDFGFDREQLISFAWQDVLVGKDQGNKTGIEFTSDGNILYALIRQLKPIAILEIGTHLGGSARHMASACVINDIGLIWTVDIEDTQAEFKEPYHSYITFVHANIDHYLEELIANNRQFDFIFEDGLHSEGQVHNIYNAMHFILKPGGYIVSHDTAMAGVGDYIRNRMRKGGADMSKVRFYQVDGTPGFSMYRYEG